MKRIYFWIKVALSVLIFGIVFMIFFQNRETHITFNYLIGSSSLNLSLFIFIIFVVGSAFTVMALTLLNISKTFQHTNLKSTVKRLEKENEELKRKTHVL